MMGHSMLIRATLLAPLVVATGFLATSRAPAADRHADAAIRIVAGDATSRSVSLGVGKSVVIELPQGVKDVLMADPSIADLVLRTSRRAYLIGKSVGQTNVFFFDQDGNQIAGFDIAVTGDLNGIRDALKQALPNANIDVQAIGEHGVILNGTVTTPAESQLAYEIASQLVKTARGYVTTGSTTSNGGGGSTSSSTTVPTGGTGGVINNIIIKGRDQVMLKVTVAEVQRDVIKQLGIDLSGSVRAGTSVVNFNNVNPFSAFGSSLSNSAIKAQQGVTADPITAALSPRVSATLRAMERAGVIRTLAEPTLTAISGETANFLVGGEFPIPGNYTCDPTSHSCQVSVQFKKFGVGLNFTPVVLSGGRISLKVMTEVSELSSENALTLTQSIGDGNTQTLTIPSIKTRRADTTLEIPSGGSMALAGLIQQQTKQQINGLPGLMQLPILGSLFKSRDFVNNQTELAVIVTPYVVRAVAANKLSRPDDGFADASDPATVLLGHLNRIYGVARPVAHKGAYHGNYGFILD